jgi:hypothetical protein
VSLPLPKNEIVVHTSMPSLYVDSLPSLFAATSALFGCYRFFPSDHVHLWFSGQLFSFADMSARVWLARNIPRLGCEEMG